MVVDDCYNANGDSMVAAVETVSELAKQGERRWVAVLGEMRELGEWSVSEHRRVGEALVRGNAAVVATYGSDALEILNGMGTRTAAKVNEENDIDSLYASVVTQLQPGDMILVKGSRGSRMERFIEKLKGEVE